MESRVSNYVGAIDQGTTSTRFIVFDRRGRVISVAQKDHRQIYPAPGWVEHDPQEIWQHTADVGREALRRAGIDATALAAVGIANQRETAVVWDRATGQPVCNAVVWQDTRTHPIVDELRRAGEEDWLRGKTGLPLATYFSGPKICWILDNVDGVRARAENADVAFGTVDSWLIWNLTGGPNGGVHVTDVSNASRTQMMDLKRLAWDADSLDTFGVPRSMLPEIRPSSEVYAEVSVGDLKGVPLGGDLGDQQAAMFGQTCFAAGDAKSTYGTGNFVLLNTGAEAVPSKRGLVTTVNYMIGEQPPVYALEGSIANTGAAVHWLRDNLGLIGSAAEVEDLARTVEDNGGCYFVPAFSGLFAPYWKGDARGVIVGLTRYVNKGHVARAALEATAWQTREVLDAMNGDCGFEPTSLKVDGGMVQNQFLMQFQADVLGVPVCRPKVAETTALGAAYAAGLAVGFWPNTDELRANWEKDEQWEPQLDPRERERRYRLWKKAVARTFDWVE